jgi:hypothetical protein
MHASYIGQVHQLDIPIRFGAWEHKYALHAWYRTGYHAPLPATIVALHYASMDDIICRLLREQTFSLRGCR